jgi:hypothetical protein
MKLQSLVSDLMWLRTLYDLSIPIEDRPHTPWPIHHAPVWAMRELQAYKTEGMGLQTVDGIPIAPERIVRDDDLLTGVIAPEWDACEETRSRYAQALEARRNQLPILYSWRVWFEDTAAALSQHLFRAWVRADGEPTQRELAIWVYLSSGSIYGFDDVCRRLLPEEDDEPERLARRRSSVARVVDHVEKTWHRTGLPTPHCPELEVESWPERNRDAAYTEIRRQKIPSRSIRNPEAV